MGIRFACNIFESNQHDVWIDPTSGIILNPGVRLLQHKTYPTIVNNVSAGNKFVDSWLAPLCVTGSNADTDLNMGCCDDIDEDLPFVNHAYRYHNSELNSTNLTGEMGSTCGMSISNLGIDLNGCNEYSGILPPGNEEQQRLTATTEYQEKYEEWLELVDGGDTESLTAEVISTTFSDALETYASLLEHSPNLSEEVMIETIKKEYELPAVLLTQILSSNPQAAKSEEVQKALDDRAMPLDEWQKEQINQGLLWVSQKEELEAQMAGQLYLRSAANASLIKQIAQNENISDKFSAISELLDDETFLHERLIKASLLRAQGDLNGAVALLEGASGFFALKPAEEEEIQTLAYLWQLESQLALMEAPSLTEAQEDELYNFYFGMGNGSGAKAMDLLVKYGAYDYEPYLLSSPELRSFQSDRFVVSDEPIAFVYPNPATDFAILKLGTPLSSSHYVQILDVTGRILESWILQPGQLEMLIPVQQYPVQSFSVVISDANGLIVESISLVKQP